MIFLPHYMWTENNNHINFGSVRITCWWTFPNNSYSVHTVLHPSLLKNLNYIIEVPGRELASLAKFGVFGMASGLSFFLVHWSPMTFKTIIFISKSSFKSFHRIFGGLYLRINLQHGVFGARPLQGDHMVTFCFFFRRFRDNCQLCKLVRQISQNRE